MDMSEIVVLIPHYNNIDGLYRSLASISAVEPVDVLVVDDGSRVKPDLCELRRQFPQTERIELVCLEKNRGIEIALNTGLKKLVNGYKYIARLDCGDVCSSRRFKIQKNFLENNPDCGLVGSWTSFSEQPDLTAGNSPQFLVRYPESYAAVRKRMLFNSAFAHQAVMIRSAIFSKAGCYSTNYPGAEDYDLFFRIIQISKAANIPQVLTACELSDNGLSRTNRHRQIVSRVRLIWKYRSMNYVRASFGIVRNLLLLLLPHSFVAVLKSFKFKLAGLIKSSKPDLPQVIHVIECAAGGTLDVVADLANGLPEFRHCVVYGKRHDTPVDIAARFFPGVELVVWKNARRKVGFHDVLALCELIRIFFLHRNAKVIHLHSSKAGFIGRVAAALCRMSDKVIFTSHGAAFLCSVVEPLKGKLFTFAERFSAKLGGRVIACSASERDEFLKRRIPAEFVCNGVQVFTAEKRASVSGNVLTVISAGRLVRQKNPQLFAKIAERFVGDSRVKFVWIGDGDFPGALANNIHVTGWLTRTEVNTHLQAADIYLSTSLWEGMPLSVLQAMQAGLPLILSDCVGNRDLVRQFENGYLFCNITEAIIGIEELIRDRSIREKLGGNSKRIVLEQFGFENMFENYRRLYFEIIAG